ncbi:MAG: SEC-C metal-binding domain-containing protein [Planctomycetota bacterium]
MTSGLLQRARATPLVQSAIAAFGAEVDQRSALAALQLARRDLDESAVTTLLCALAAANSLPPAAEFVPALALIAGLDQFLGLLAMSPDDPSGALLDLHETGTLSRQRECVALLVVAVRHRRQSNGAPADARIRRLLRLQMRNPGSIDEAMILAVAVEQLGDAEVTAAGETLGLARPSAVVTRRLLEMLDPGWRDFVPERLAPRIQVGTVRRQAPKVQRNDPCPCGSGRKFKKCCASKVDVEDGLVVEPSADAHDYAAMRPAELARLDPQLIDRHGLIDCVRVASHYHQWELAERFMAALDADLQDPEKADDYRHDLCNEAAAAGAADAALRIAAAAHDPQRCAAGIGLEIGLLRPDADTVAKLEEKAAAGLRGDSDSLYELAFGLLDHLPALGILVGRGALDPSRPFDSWTLVDAIEEARDGLLLPPGDPAARTLEQMSIEHAEAAAQRADRKAIDGMARTLEEKQRALEAAQREAEGLQARMIEASRRITQLEQQTSPMPRAPQQAAARTAAPAGESMVQLQSELVRLRGRVTELKGLVTENLDRRKELERQLEARGTQDGATATDRDADTAAGRALGNAPAVASAGGGVGAGLMDADDGVETVDEVLAPRTVSVPVFEEVAAQALHRLERAMAARIVRAVGLLAAADPGTWRDVKALRAVPGFLRLRVGQWRVLFREDGEGRRLMIVQIVVRGELEAAVRRLR